MIKFCKIASAIAIVLSAMSVQAQTAPAFDLLGLLANPEVTTTTDNQVSGTATARGVCSFAADAEEMALGTPVVRALANGAQVVTATGGRAGVLTVAGYTQADILPRIDIGAFNAFGQGTKTGMIGFKVAANGAAEPTAITTVVNRNTHRFNLPSASNDLYISHVATHSTTGFNTVGELYVTATVTCR